MKVKQLKEILEQYPPDMRVCVNGYENGFDNVARTYRKNVFEIDREENWWDGEYQAEPGDEGGEDIPITILVISRH